MHFALCYSRNDRRSLSKCLILIIGSLIMAHGANAQEPTLMAESPKDFVNEILPYSLDQVHERALSLFNSDGRDYYEDYNAHIYDLPEPVTSYKELSAQAMRQFMALPLVRPNKFYVFFGAYGIMQHRIADMTPLAAMGHSNAALQQYAALPMAQRAYDLYIWSPDTPYWHSEYFLNGKALPFKSFFFLHMEPVDDTHTKVEIIEDQPLVRLNNMPNVDAHGAVHEYLQQEVEPTTNDREFLLSCLSQFIERKVPGRHWFNCRVKGEVVEAPMRFTDP